MAVNDLDLYYPEAALWQPHEAAKEMECEKLNVVVAAKYGWKSRYNHIAKALRVVRSIWDVPFALAGTGEDLWVLVPTYAPYRPDADHDYIWLAGNRRSAKSVSKKERDDGATFYFVRDWKEVSYPWIADHLISDLAARNLDYDRLPDRLWV